MKLAKRSGGARSIGLCFYTALLLAVLFSAEPVLAQSISVNLGVDKAGSMFTSKMIQFMGLVTILSIAPSILIMVTSFTRIVVVFSFLRTALGLQQTPPNTVLVSLSLFLTFFIMSPTFEKSYNDGVKPLMHEEIEEIDAFEKIAYPFHEFMLSNTREKDISLFVDIAKVEVAQKKDLPYRVLIPAFMVSELKRAFEIGFLIFIPFLIIDMLVASVLMAMGMMMIPPVMISLPFKLIFFVMIDGWYMLSASLVKSYAGG